MKEDNDIEDCNKITNMNISMGEIILFSEGNYSDYGYCGRVIFTMNCNLNLLVRIYRSETNKENKTYSDQVAKFPSWLVAKGFCVPLESREIWLGEYDEFFQDFIKEKKDA
jgi:hypothetical protein